MLFPLEVIDSFIDSLAAEDDEAFTSVKACSLVSRSLLPRTRTYIFRSIAINNHLHLRALTCAPTPFMFQRLISQTPEIAHYVTTLYYLVKDEDFAVKGFATALGCLTKLKSLTVQSNNIQWKDLLLRETLLNLMHLPTLTHLELKYVKGFSLADLTLCVALKNLKVDNINLGIETSTSRDVVVFQERPPSLETYLGRYSDNFNSLLKQLCTSRRIDGKPVVDISELKKASIEIGRGPLDDIKEFFRCCAKLIDVHIISCQRLIGPEVFADLLRPSLQNLQHIHLDFLLANESPTLPIASKFIANTGNNRIQSVKISAFIWFTDCTYGDEWSALDTLFTQSRWEELKIFSLHIIVEYNIQRVEEFVEFLWKLPETRLTRLANSKDIQFNFDVSSQGVPFISF